MKMPGIRKPRLIAAVSVGGLLATGLIVWSVGQSGTYSSASAPAATARALTSSHAAAQGASKSVSSGTARMVQRQAALTLQVAHVQKDGARITAEIDRLHGYVASSHVMSAGTGGKKHSIEMTLRVPQTDFSHVISQLQGLGRQKTFSQQGFDVTRQYQSLSLQKTTLQNEASAYQRLFSKATSMKTMLQIQQALARVQANLQSVQQQQSSLTRSVNLSTISLTLLPVSTVTHRTQSFGSAFLSSWSAMKQVAANMVVGAGWAAPWLILIALLGIPSRYLWPRLHRQKS